ncbi:MAG TPA: nuclear transport factor 2 family protein [Caulobacteraceae bacterium]
MTTRDVADGLVAMCKQGKFAEAGERYWADDIVSVEFGGAEPVSRGKAAARAKGVWWAGQNEFHGAEVEGPWVNGDQFAVRFTMDVTSKQSGQRMSVDEIALYTLRGGKIAEERFFYAG